jgi:hypothetical protein
MILATDQKLLAANLLVLKHLHHYRQQLGGAIKVMLSNAMGCGLAETGEVLSIHAIQ